jgi:hypothetical protein
LPAPLALAEKIRKILDKFEGVPIKSLEQGESMRGAMGKIATARSCLVGLGVSIAVACMGSAGVALAGSPPTLWSRCPTGSGATQCAIPRGIAVDPVSGHVYIADQGNNRVVELDAWGEFVKAWGWGVRNGAPELQTCTSESGCQTGSAGGGAGQLDEPQGVTVDTAGDVYVADRTNLRVEKFDPTAGVGEDEAKFLLAIGGNVNKTKVDEAASEEKRNLCPIDPGDVCQAGTAGAGKGQFAAWPPGGEEGSFIAIAPGSGGETLYVGDVGRVEEFDTSGKYLKDLPDPEGLFAQKLSENRGVRALAADPAGHLYLSFAAGEATEPQVRELNTAGEEECSIAAFEPKAIATDGAGGVYLITGKKAIFEEIEVRKFAPGCGAETVDSSFPFHDGIDLSTGIATGEACGIEGIDLYLANASSANSFLRAYGPHPDPTICPPPKVKPDVVASYATSAGAESAVVKAQINPHFWPGATYFVEYGTGKCSEGGCLKKALPSGPLGGGVQDAPILTPGIVLAGLAPGTVYHLRFTAENHFGPGEDSGPAVGAEAAFTTYPPRPHPRQPDPCPNAPFRSGPAASLPDCRAFELASPLDKEGGSVRVLTGNEVGRPARIDQASPGLGGEGEAERLTYSSYRAFDQPPSAPYSTQYLAERGPGGWTNTAITPPEEGVDPLELHETHYQGFTEDLCSGWVLQGTEPLIAPGAIAGYPNLYRRESCGAGGFEALSTVKPKVAASEFGSGGKFSTDPPSIQGFSADGALQVFGSPGELVEGEANEGFSLYAKGPVGPVAICVMPDGEPDGESCELGTQIGRLRYIREDSFFNAVSADGRRIFWSDAKKGKGQIYVRRNPLAAQSKLSGGKCSEAAKACTTAVTAGPAFFWGASSDGSRVIYSTASGELFEAELEEVGAHLVVHTQAIGGGVSGLAGMSSDAGLVYLVSSEALTGAPNEKGDIAQPGALNLFLYRAPKGASPASFAFVGTLSKADLGKGGEGPASEEPYRRVSRVSADGQHAVFMSRARLTGYDNTDQASGEADAEVFLYDAGSGSLACISCNPSGARPAGRELNDSGAHINGPIAAQIPGWEDDWHDPRLLSANGNRLFFESFEALVLRDTDGTQDVYEWERGGGSQGGCEALGAELFLAASGGCLSLISSGESPSDSAFVDASADGRDVFFTTAASLVPQDPGLIDIYDAREGGGFPPPAAPKAECEGEACQSPPPSPEYATPGSSSFRGQANPTRKGHKAKKHKHKGKAKHRRHRRHS